MLSDLLCLSCGGFFVLFCFSLAAVDVVIAYRVVLFTNHPTYLVGLNQLTLKAAQMSLNYIIIPIPEPGPSEPRH